ncbi:hypothetical protein ACCD06_15650 [Azospirillum sp. CT11-132]|uniref:hypothetical protein n=1 Tax=Azospirillum sp. CT11-132 TaxID=3396317 RepID=UPI0039A760ED
MKRVAFIALLMLVSPSVFAQQSDIRDGIRECLNQAVQGQNLQYKKLYSQGQVDLLLYCSGAQANKLWDVLGHFSGDSQPMVGNDNSRYISRSGGDGLYCTRTYQAPTGASANRFDCGIKIGVSSTVMSAM